MGSEGSVKPEASGEAGGPERPGESPEPPEPPKPSADDEPGMPVEAAETAEPRASEDPTGCFSFRCRGW